MNQLLVTAYHEAAHAVAAQLRGGTVIALELEPGLTTYRLPGERQRLFRNGVMVNKLEPQAVTLDDAFIAYAGPWAATRCRWNLALDEQDEHGYTFSQYVAAVLKQNISDHQTYLEAEPPTGIEAAWSAELEQAWPRIQTVAGRMYAMHRQHLGRRRDKGRPTIPTRRMRAKV